MEKQTVDINRVDARLHKLHDNGEKGLFTFITAGDPDLETTFKLVLSMEKAGADLVELGAPFSDPMADGPVIQRASLRSLAGGTNLRGILEMVRRLRLHTEIPLLLMTYYNPVFRYGLECFALDAAEAGVDGVIVPDLPLEESAPLLQELKKEKMHLICLAAPTTTPQRLKKISAAAGGFIYCVSLTGVTGMREGISPDIAGFLQRVKRHSSLPLAVGFGISNPGQAAFMAEEADAVIVGSALVSLVEQFADQPDVMLKGVAGMIRGLKGAII
jgi:tryptophan synthase alpha chain